MTIRIDGTNTTANPGITGADADTGLQFGTDEVKIVTGGTDAVTVDASQNVGVGTSSPGTIFNIRTDASDDGILLEKNDGTDVVRLFFDATSSDARLDMFSGGTAQIQLKANGDSHISGGNVGIGDTSPDAPLTVTGGAIRSKNVTGDTGFDFYENGSAALVRQRNNRSILFYTNNTQQLTINNSGILFSTPTYGDETANSANVFISSTGRLSRFTSSLKYKTDVETLQDSYADAVLNCRPVWYRSTTGNDNPEWGWWGFIAEEVAEIDPRLVHWKTIEVTYDEEGSTVESPCDPEPEGVAYDRFVPHLLNLIKRQKEQIETLETQNAEQATTIASFEARISALEGGN